MNNLIDVKRGELISLSDMKIGQCYATEKDRVIKVKEIKPLGILVKSIETNNDIFIKNTDKLKLYKCLSYNVIHSDKPKPSPIKEDIVPKRIVHKPADANVSEIATNNSDVAKIVENVPEPEVSNSDMDNPQTERKKRAKKEPKLQINFNMEECLDFEEKVSIFSSFLSEIYGDDFDGETVKIKNTKISVLFREQKNRSQKFKFAGGTGLYVVFINAETGKNQRIGEYNNNVGSPDRISKVINKII